MLENGILHEHDKLQPTSSPGAQSRDSTHAAPDYGSEGNTGSMECTGQWETDRKYLFPTINAQLKLTMIISSTKNMF
jgi:hypothetical protein